MTYEEMIATARRLASEGRLDDARRVAQAAVASRGTSPVAPVQPAQERSRWDAVVDNVVGRNDGVESYGEMLGQMLNLGGESMTMGLVGDEVDAGIRSAFTDATYDEALAEERAQEDAFRTAHPGLALTAEVGGAMALPAGLMARGGNLALRSTQAAGVGAAGAGTYGFMEGEGQKDRIADAQSGMRWGGIIGGAIPVAGRGVQKVADALMGNRAIRQAAAAAPDADALRAQAQGIYASADNASFPRQDFAAAAQGITGNAQRHGLDPMLTPQAARVADNMGEAAASPDPSIGFRELDILRRQAGIPAGDVTNRTQSALGSQMAEGIDAFVESADPALAGQLSEARRMWGILRRTERLDEAFARAARSASGFENGLKIEFRRILNSPAQRRGFSPAEIAAMERVVNGTVLSNLLRQAGRLAPSFDSRQSNALGALAGVSAGGAAFGALGAVAVPLLAAGAKAASSRSTINAAEIARALTRAGGVQDLPQLSDQTRRIIEALMMGGSRPLLPTGQ